jgi:hypothetical protein
VFLGRWTYIHTIDVLLNGYNFRPTFSSERTVSEKIHEEKADREGFDISQRSLVSFDKKRQMVRGFLII